VDQDSKSFYYIHLVAALGPQDVLNEPLVYPSVSSCLAHVLRQGFVKKMVLNSVRRFPVKMNLTCCIFRTIDRVF
jgi:hypothetical protein